MYAAAHGCTADVLFKRVLLRWARTEQRLLRIFTPTFHLPRRAPAIIGSHLRITSLYLRTTTHHRTVTPRVTFAHTLPVLLDTRYLPHTPALPHLFFRSSHGYLLLVGFAFSHTSRYTTIIWIHRVRYGR